MLYKIVLAAVALAAVLPTSYSTSLHDVPKESTPSLTAMKDEFVLKHPDLVHWIERAVVRVKEHRNASQADLLEVRHQLDQVRERVYEFVTSPIFFITTDIFIDRAISVMSPLLGVLPIKELKELAGIFQKDPSLSEVLSGGGGDADITQLVPDAVDLDKWFVNSTAHIFQETMGSIVPKNAGTEVVTVV